MRTIAHVGIRDQVSGLVISTFILTVWDGMEWNGVEWNRIGNIHIYYICKCKFLGVLFENFSFIYMYLSTGSQGEIYFLMWIMAREV